MPSQIIFRFGSLPVTREALPFIGLLSATMMYGAITGFHHLVRDPYMRLHRSNQH